MSDNSKENVVSNAPLADNLETVASVIEADPKNWWKSKTIWVNVGAIISMVAAKYGFNIHFSEEMLTSIPLVLGIVNIFLRSITSKPISK